MNTLSRIALTLTLFLLASAPSEAKKRLSITSEPSGAQVEMGGQIIGQTPIETDLDDFWFDGPSEREPRFLNVPVVIKLTKTGFAPKQAVISRGPFDWISADLLTRKVYFVVGASVKVKLDSISRTETPIEEPSSGNVNWYKRASQEINRKARDELQKVLSSKPVDVDTETLFASGTVCGPLLWEALASKELDSALTMDLIMKLPKASKKQGKFFKTSSQKRAFWDAFIQEIREGNSVFVRGATREEIDYYWATIPFNIEEPLFVVDIGKHRVLFNFLVKDGKPQIFWMDIIGELT